MPVDTIPGDDPAQRDTTAQPAVDSRSPSTDAAAVRIPVPDDGELKPNVGLDGIVRPAVRILEPKDGALATQALMLRWESALAEGVEEEAVEIRIDGRRIMRLDAPVNERLLNTRFLGEEGLHTIEVTLYDTNRRKGHDSVEVRVRNPSFALERLSRRSGEASAGSEVVIEVTTTGHGFVPSVDLSSLDSGFDPERVRWEMVEESTDDSTRRYGSLGSSRQLLEYSISPENQRPDGSYWVTVTLEDREEASIQDTERVRIELRNHAVEGSLRDAFQVSCGVYRPDPVPPAGHASPRLEAVEGPASARVGEPLALSLRWDTQEGRGDRFLRLSADGFRGHYVMHGRCGLEDTLELDPRRATDDAPYRLVIWPSEGLPRVHEVTVDPAIAAF